MSIPVFLPSGSAWEMHGGNSSVVAYFPMFFGVLLAAVTVLPPACTSATLDCTEWIRPEGQPSRVLVYRTHSFEKRNENIKRAFVFVHGILRDADNHFRTAL